MLRKWDFYTGFPERGVDRDRELTPRKKKAIDEGPAEQGKIKRALAEAIEYGKRCRVSPTPPDAFELLRPRFL